MTDHKRTAPETVEQFNTALAKALWEMGKASRIRSQAADMLGHFGIELPEGITADSGESAPEFKVPAYDPTTDYVGDGLNASDLNPDAQAKRQAAKLRDAKRSAFRWFKNQAEHHKYGYSGYLSAEQIARHLPALGLPSPVTRTTINAAILNGGSGTRTRFTVVVDGTVTEDQAREKLAGQGSHTDAYNVATTAFGEGVMTEELVSVSCETEVTWASTSEVE